VREPRLTVVLPAPGALRAVDRTIAALERQSAAAALEVVVTTGAADPGPPPPAWARAPFAVRLVPAPDATATAALVAGIRAARAPLVAVGEDHAFPEPGWAAAVLARFAADRRVGAVAPAMANANPATALSWGNLLVAYTAWVAPVADGPVASVPVHGTTFRRAALLAHADALPALLGRGGALAGALTGDGHVLVLAADAVVHHVNPSRAGSTLRLRTDAGRLEAAGRAGAAGWPAARRAAYAAAAPAIPLVRWRRVAGELRGRGHAVRGRRAAGLAAALAADAAGQALGFAAGPGLAAERLDAFERDRARHVRRRDRALVM